MAGRPLRVTVNEAGRLAAILGIGVRAGSRPGHALAYRPRGRRRPVDLVIGHRPRVCRCQGRGPMGAAEQHGQRVKTEFWSEWQNMGNPSAFCQRSGGSSSTARATARPSTSTTRSRRSQLRTQPAIGDRSRRVRGHEPVPRRGGRPGVRAGAHRAHGDRGAHDRLARLPWQGDQRVRHPVLGPRRPLDGRLRRRHPADVPGRWHRPPVNDSRLRRGDVRRRRHRPRIRPGLRGLLHPRRRPVRAGRAVRARHQQRRIRRLGAPDRLRPAGRDRRRQPVGHAARRHARRARCRRPRRAVVAARAALPALRPPDHRDRGLHALGRRRHRRRDDPPARLPLRAGRQRRGRRDCRRVIRSDGPDRDPVEHAAPASVPTRSGSSSISRRPTTTAPSATSRSRATST